MIKGQEYTHSEASRLVAIDLAMENGGLKTAACESFGLYLVATWHDQAATIEAIISATAFQQRTRPDSGPFE